MATIEKRGGSYKIVVSLGYDIHGKQLRERMTWTPPEGLTPRQVEKELNRQATLFEEQAKNGAARNGKVRFKDFSEVYLREYASVYLAPKTQRKYAEDLVVINNALGHIRLCEMKPAHISSFYRNLQEEGVRGSYKATCKIDLAAWVKDQQKSLSCISRETGVSRKSINTAISGGNISLDGAEALAAAMGVKVDDAFNVAEDRSPLSSATVLAYHRTLSAVLGRAARWGYITSNPANMAEKPSLGHTEAAYFEEDEARRILALLYNEPIKWRVMVTFDLLSGLRRAELLGAPWSSVDFDAQTMRVTQTLNYLPNIGVYIKTPKNVSSDRPLKLPRTAVLLLLEYKRWQDSQKEKLGDAWKNEDDLIFTQDDGSPVFPDSLTHWFHDFLIRNGFPEGLSIHSLRHTYATLMINDGRPLVVVSKQMGHAKTSTTEDIYAHVIASAQAKAAEALDRFEDIVILGDEPEEPPGAPQKRAVGK